MSLRGATRRGNIASKRGQNQTCLNSAEQEQGKDTKWINLIWVRGRLPRA